MVSSSRNCATDLRQKNSEDQFFCKFIDCYTFQHLQLREEAKNWQKFKIIKSYIRLKKDICSRYHIDIWQYHLENQRISCLVLKSTNGIPLRHMYLQHRLSPVRSNLFVDSNLLSSTRNSKESVLSTSEKFSVLCRDVSKKDVKLCSCGMTDSIKIIDKTTFIMFKIMLKSTSLLQKFPLYSSSHGESFSTSYQ